MTLKVNNENFESKIMNSEKPVLLDFGAEWCMPCKMIEPVLEEISSDHGDKVEVASINVDECPEIATNFSVMNIPTLIFLKKGKEVNRMVGVNTKENIIKAIKESFSE